MPADSKPKKPRTPAQQEASRKNGALSTGPSKSPRHALRHGVTASQLVLTNEDHDSFDRVLRDYADEYQPQGPTECNLVEDIAYARWQLYRAWCTETAVYNSEIARNLKTVENQFTSFEESIRTADALESSLSRSASLLHLHRCNVRVNRQYHRSLAVLLTLRKTPRPPRKTAESNPAPPDQALQTQHLDAPPPPETRQPQAARPQPAPLAAIAAILALLLAPAIAQPDAAHCGIVGKKRRTSMNLLLFPQPNADPAPEILAKRDHGIAAAIAKFEQWMAAPDSPVRAVKRLEARPAQFADMPAAVNQDLARALHDRGIHQLYTHQRAAFDLVQAGKNVAIVTPTASGKTLCYNLPVLNRILEDPTARAMYLFPTKALAEDQLHEFQAAADQMGSKIKAFTYDGDTPQDARRAIRERANVVFTNPDMMHSGILPHHTKWAKAFENLKYIVIDELHYYRGVYGSHLANLLRRLRRICAFYGSDPQFICCSATIANPRQLAESLIEKPFDLVDQNGAPSGEKFIVFYNPPVVNKQLGIRRSYLHETRRIAQEFIDRGQQTLVFANNRLATEVLVTYLKDAAERGPHSADSIRGYRGGYLPKERREIERRLRDGQIRAVVATNALELGIDIGSLDAVVMAGYPGTVASTWQRAGRAGRRQSTSIAVMVASSAPLDQFIIEHPEYFFDRPPESANVNPDNLEILLNHLRCAAFELPVRDGETFGPHDTAEMCKFLEDTKLLHHAGGAWHWTSDTYPADAVSLRTVTSDNFVVIDTTGDHKVIADVAFPAALATLHEKAIYLHEARQYQVERFDYDGRKAYVKRVDCDYFTDAIDYTQVKQLETFDSQPAGLAQAASGEVRVNTQVVGFKKVKFYTLENVGAGHLSMPAQEMHTTAFWLHFPQAFLARFPDLSPNDRQNAIAGLGNALRTVAALLLMCDPRDLGVSTTEDINGALRSFEPNLYLYDNFPGGIGLSGPLYQALPQLLAGARELLRGCPCEAGCPGCVGPLGEVGEGGKDAALRILLDITA